METNHTEEILLGAFSEVPDPRASYNQKHRFIDILTITILATICGADTWDEIEDWGNTNLEWLFRSYGDCSPRRKSAGRCFLLTEMF